MASFGTMSRVPASLTARTSARYEELSNGVPHGPPPAGQRMLWPSTGAGGFSRLQPATPNAQPVRTMRSPDVYVATYDTMPPQQQVIRTAPMHDVLRQLYQQSDRKTTGKRDSAPDAAIQGELRPAKTPRAN